MKPVDNESDPNVIFTSQDILNRAVAAVKQNKDTDMELFDIIEKNIINSTSENGLEMAIKDIEQLVKKHVND